MYFHFAAELVGLGKSTVDNDGIPVNVVGSCMQFGMTTTSSNHPKWKKAKKQIIYFVPRCAGRSKITQNIFLIPKLFLFFS